MHHSIRTHTRIVYDRVLPMPAIDTEAFLRGPAMNCVEIGAFRTGVHRPTFSPQDMESRRWLMERLTTCGLDASIDGIGNVYGPS